MTQLISKALGLLAATALFSTAAYAGGFDRGGVKIDQLFDTQRYSFDSEISVVLPQRTIKNVTRASSLSPFPPQTSRSIDVDSDYTVPRIGFKAGFGDAVDCLASYTRPYGADSEYGLNNAYSPTAVDFSIETDDYSLTCAYKFKTSLGQFRAIAGVSYLEVEAFQSRQSFGDFAPLGGSVVISPLLPPINPQGVATFNLEDEAFGWRVGAAYELPEIALRASLVYSSKYELDGLEGIVDSSALGGLAPITAVSASTEIPQALEFKFQTGIAENTLLFGSLKWQQWSRLGIVPIQGVTSPTDGSALTNISFDPLYQDGITASLGLGRKFNDEFSGLVSLGYDRGTSTTSGTQTDTYTISAGLSYQANENLELKFGGLAGILTSGNSNPTGGDSSNDVTFTFDNDFVGAFNLSAKLKF